MRYTLEQLTPLLEAVEKPGQYTGGECNSIIKEEASLKFALCYPDLYEVGMANNGIQILYSIVNGLDFAACERVCVPAPDFFKELKKAELKLYTLETFTQVSDFDILGFNLSHELLYTNVLYILDGSGIPLLSKDRDESHPLVIAGGEAASNPAPMHPYIDAFFFGEGEEGIVAITKTVYEAKRNGLDRKQILEILSKLEGIFVPSQRDYKENSDGMLCYTGSVTVKRTSDDLARNVALKPVVPNIRISQDRAVVEITRGCDNLCKFCHAGYYTLPYRTYGYEDAARDALEILDNTGYDGVTFTSLSISDYTYLVPLINRVLPELNRRGAGMNLPSLKVDKNTIPLIEILSKVKRVSLTFAVESAHTEIRKIIHKRLSLDELREIVSYIFDNGWKTIKLYFMLGLPGYKEYDEIESMIGLIREIHNLGRGRKNVNVTVSPFVPKVHTPFQYENMAPLEYFDEAVKKIKSSVPRKVSVKNHNIYSSVLEGFLARGDIRSADAVLEAYTAGCFLDSWSEYFRSDIWYPIIQSYVQKGNYFGERSDTFQPWSIVEAGCAPLLDAKRRKILSEEELSDKRMKVVGTLDEDAIEESLAELESRYELHTTLRLKCTKTGRARFLSHLDYAQVIKRALRMARVPLCVSRGFNKRDQLSFGFPLPLGVESECELLDCLLAADVKAGFMEEINRVLPEGVHVLAAQNNEGKQSIMAQTQLTSYRVTCSRSQAEEAAEYCSDKEAVIEKKSKRGFHQVAIPDAIYSIETDENGLILMLHTGTADSLRIDNIVSFLRVRGIDTISRVVKTAVYSLEKGRTTSLM